MHTLVLLRHGQSLWNLQNLFTGWTDVDLTDTGRDEARRAGRLLAEGGYEFDQCHTSVLTRAVRTLWIVMDGLECLWLPVFRHWRLNERHYGALQGLDKAETSRRYGKDKVFAWRRSFDVPPPFLDRSDERWPGHDRRYADLDEESVPVGESLAMTIERTLPCWFDTLAPRINAGKRLLVCAHGNSLRGLVKYLDDVSDDEIAGVNIPTGVPLVYRLDKDLAPLEHFYLGDPEEVARAERAVAEQASAGKGGA